MPIWSNFGDLYERNKEKFENVTFVCDKCNNKIPFLELIVSVVPSGFDYLCPHCRTFIMIAEDIADLIEHPEPPTDVPNVPAPSPPP